MSKLSYGLNITKKPPLGQRPPPAKRKTIFDEDSGPEDGPDNEDTSVAISTIGGFQPSKPQSSGLNSTAPPSRTSKPPKVSQYGDLSTKHAVSKYSKSAEEIDPNIYDYDAVYDSLHAAPISSTTSTLDAEKKPKYMGNLLAAAETRKRDQVRAKEKMLAKEREAEGDEFADKEKFVTAAYKRQQAEMRKAEEEEAQKEREADERRRREGGGMKALYKNMLERDEQKHKEVIKAVEEGRGREDKGNEGEEQKKEKSEAELAKEKGAVLNEEGQIVDKRQLLSAGLNAASAPKPRSKPQAAPKGAARGSATGNKRARESSRDRETRLFEEQLLGKGSASDDSDNEDERASKSRKLEDELLGLGTP
ncbi:coiled-coil domain-containing protein 55, partial [Lecanoromycetidae sp. Uapishka_2]